MKEKLRNLFFKVWYWYISTIDKKADIIFMNFGYSHPDMQLNLEEKDENNKYSVQLYHKVVAQKNLDGKDLLEVGCGRGGGLSYINRYLSPKSVTGIDLNNKAIKFCNKFYTETNSKFYQADAQNLPFDDNSFDFVINVESSHRYPSMQLFLNEVNRVLKPGGYFAITDFRYDFELEELDNQINAMGLTLESRENITENVVEALRHMTPDRKMMVKKFLPKFLHGIGNNFAATEGTETFNYFKSGKYEYFHYILKK